MSKNRDKLLEMIEDGTLDSHTLAKDLLGYLSDDDCKEFAEKNDIELFPEEDDEQEGEFEFFDEHGVREAFTSFWNERCSEVPAYREDKPAKRQAFTVFVDDLQRDGRISDDLANNVTLGDDD